MKGTDTKSLVSVLTGVCFALVAATGSAHHPIRGKFDDSKPLTLSGIVSYVDWRNPHAHIFMSVLDAGESLNWAIELASPIELQASGWTSASVQPGDALTVTGIAARNGTRQVWGESVLRSDSGRRILGVSMDPPAVPLTARPTPRWPDGQPVLGGSSSTVDGYWGYPQATALVEDGVDVSAAA